MPIYEYQCHACGKVNEILQKIGDDAPASCDTCSGGPLTKLLSRSGFILKGSGWYATDFKGGGAAKPAAAGSADSGTKDGAASDGGAKDGATSDSGSKTETKAASGGCATGCGHNH